MMKKLLFLLSSTATIFSLVSCSGRNDVETIINAVPLPAIKTVSLNYHSSSAEITVSRDIQKEGAKVNLKKGVSWINNLVLEGNKITFDVEENSNTSTGHRSDSIQIIVNEQRIGVFCVTQARNPFCDKRLVWANSNALYRTSALSNRDLSGLEMTKLVYNLEKTTNGKDSYKNYPAFAFCIEMNNDPENNMEWYLPSVEELKSYAHAQSYKDTPIEKHNYWWSSSENYYDGYRAFNVYTGSIASRGAVSKSEDWWVVAFRNGKIEE